ncbi:hypothetical protein NL483_28045, partial [Klebsiella pneumoniae]|nr:hypothetical protein [Klebsiella pneumoniae]
METAHPLISAALKFLWSKWPSAVSFATLLGAAARELGSTQTTTRSETHDGQILAVALTQAYRSGFLHMQIAPYQLTNMV